MSIDLSCGSALVGGTGEGPPISVLGLSEEVAEIDERKCCGEEVGENAMFMAEVGVGT